MSQQSNKNNDTNKEEKRKDAITQQMYQDFFMEADKNEDGYLSFDELYQILREKKYGGSYYKIQRMFHECNVSPSGNISFEEFMSIMGFKDIKIQIKKRKTKQLAVTESDGDPRKAALKRVFQTFDVDGNGLIDKKELRSVLMSLGKYFTEKEIDYMVKNADKDGSETLNYEEFVKTVFDIK